MYSNKIVTKFHVVKIWFEVILVIPNQTRAARLLDFEITHMILDQRNCTTIGTITITNQLTSEENQLISDD